MEMTGFRLFHFAWPLAALKVLPRCLSLTLDSHCNFHSFFHSLAAANLYIVAATLVSAGYVTVEQLLPYLSPGAAKPAPQKSSDDKKGETLPQKFEDASAALSKAVDQIGAINLGKGAIVPQTGADMRRGGPHPPPPRTSKAALASQVRARVVAHACTACRKGVRQLMDGGLASFVIIVSVAEDAA